ncbi:hypothetical protein [Microtetraspora sp. NBRC 13810]|uniref:hypothetical protein n=1 Tax=Microtetraspora sp. NBRC 13810 TaxID=3030990 RepID=UPI0025529E98|nr:hypothetical protein [Microtetraspora sp. NBRC 13810]
MGVWQARRPLPPLRPRPRGPRRIWPDELVWPLPPPPADAEESSTQPFPAITDDTPPPPRTATPNPAEPDATALPAGEQPTPGGRAEAVSLREQAPASGGPATFPAGERAVPPGGRAEGGARRSGPPLPRRVPLRDRVRAAEERAAAEAVPPPARKGGSRLRIMLATVLAAVAFGTPAVDGYLLYRDYETPDRLHPVPAGQAFTFEHVSWRAEVDPADDVPGLPPAGPGRTWLKSTVTRTAVDAEGAVPHEAPVFEMRDDRGRAWTAEVVGDDAPADGTAGAVGVGYRYELVSLVPAAVADEVELHLAPGAPRTAVMHAGMGSPGGPRGLEGLGESSRAVADVLRFER